MARRRMLDPEFFFDEELATTENSAYVRLFYEGLWCHCDDVFHTLPYKPGWLKANIFPYEDVDVKKLWETLISVGKIVQFSHNGQEFGWIKNFNKFQRVEKPSLSKYPAYPMTPVGGGEYSGSPPAKVKLSKEKLREVNEMFDRVWEVYPKKVGKKDAFRAFEKLNPTEQITQNVISAIESAKETPQWTDNDGRYIPYPATFLNRESFEDAPAKKGPRIAKWEQTDKGMKPIYEKA